MGTLLFNLIDTQEEVKIILQVLQTFLKNKVALERNVTDEQFLMILAELKRQRSANYRVNHVDGSVDTPHEITLFLRILKAHGMLATGVIDTPAEVQLFMEALQKAGVLRPSFANLRNEAPPDPATPEVLTRGRTPFNKGPGSKL